MILRVLLVFGLVVTSGVTLAQQFPSPQVRPPAAPDAATSKEYVDTALGRPSGRPGFVVGTGVANNTPPIAAALAATPSVILGPATYSLQSPLNIPSGKMLQLPFGARLDFQSGSSMTMAAGGVYSATDYGALADTHITARSFGAVRGTGGQDPFGIMQYANPAFYDAIVADASDSGGLAAGRLTHYKFGGGTTKGNRVALYGITEQTAATASDNPGRNYVGASGIAMARSSDTGTALTKAGAKAAHFGLHGYCQNFAGVNLLECAGMELNVYMKPGTSARYIYGASAVGMHRVQGSVIDAAYGVGAGGEFPEFGGAVTGWRHGLNFNNVHDSDPISSDGVLIGSTWVNGSGVIDPTISKPVLIGFDLRGWAAGFGVLGKANTGSGNFLQWQDSTGTQDLFTVNPAGRVSSTGYLSRAGTSGAFGGNYVNWNWNGASLDAWVDATNLGPVLTDTGAWTAYTPTVACGGGTVGAITVAGRHKKIGKTVHLTAKIYGAVGTCTGYVIASLPFSAVADSPLYGRDGAGMAITGAVAAAGSTIAIQRYDATLPVLSGGGINFSITYETP